MTAWYHRWLKYNDWLSRPWFPPSCANILRLSPCSSFKTSGASERPVTRSQAGRESVKVTGEVCCLFSSWKRVLMVWERSVWGLGYICSSCDSTLWGSGHMLFVQRVRISNMSISIKHQIHQHIQPLDTHVSLSSPQKRIITPRQSPLAPVRRSHLSAGCFNYFISVSLSLNVFFSLCGQYVAGSQIRDGSLSPSICSP